MKKSLYILFLILFLVSCKQPQSNDFSQENIIEDTFVQKTDTLTKISEPFKVNDIECYWIHYITEYDARMVLKNYKTNQILIDTDLIMSYWLTERYRDDDYFDEVNKVCFKDINFDSFRDFHCFNGGSNGAISSSSLVFLFNPKTKSFDYSEDLSYYTIYEVDSINHKLILFNEFRRGQDSTVYYFDKSKTGKVKVTESFVNYISLGETPMERSEYTKTINGKVVATKRDSISMED